MEIINLLEIEDKSDWLNKIKSANWSAANFLCKIIADGTIYEECGKNTKVLLLIDGNDLISFCTLADWDDVQPTAMSPWIGFVYTLEKYRGNRYSQLLVDKGCKIAKQAKAEFVYISTKHVGLYERYGFEYYRTQKDVADEDTRIYRKKLF